MNLALINPRVLAALALAAALSGLCWWSYNTVYDRGAQAIQVKWDAEKKDQAEQSAKVATDALAVTKSLQVSADNQRKASNAQITALNTALASAVAGLSNRPSRDDAGGVSCGAATGTNAGCTGAGLYRDDGQFLVRYARDAAELRIRLESCQSQYMAVYDALNSTK